MRASPLGGLATPTRGFTAAVSVFKGTPPPKPVKIYEVRGLLAAGFRTDEKPHRHADRPRGNPFRTFWEGKQEYFVFLINDTFFQKRARDS
jgi:hypothetical protein